MIKQDQDWVEGDLYFDFSKADYVIHLDKSGKGHGLSHLLKAVDFIVEDKGNLFFIEIKNPENSRIPLSHKEESRRKFSKQMESNKLNETLLKKFTDSLIFQSLNKGIPEKKFIYAVFIGLSELDPVLLSNLKDKFKNSSDVLRNDWLKPFEIAFFNFDSWNRFFIHYPVSREMEVR